MSARDEAKARAGEGADSRPSRPQGERMQGEGRGERGMSHEGIVRMIGIDHGLASAEVRSAFSLPADVREDVLALARAKLGAAGVALIATCNRTELWASFDGVQAPEMRADAHGTPREDDAMLRCICDMHMVAPADYARYFACRADDAAVSHLFNVACGLRSAIVAEDQIVSQVKQAIAFSREIGVADGVLEVLFRQAVTSAKQVKGSIRFTRAYATAVDQAVELLERDGVDLAGARCMVIGNGEYGRLAASKLVARGAEVLVTVRQYTHGAVTVPQGCTGVPYDERYRHIGSCAVVMSATTSPNYTIESARLAEVIGARPGPGLADAPAASSPTSAPDADAPSSTSVVRFIDLAIPSDIEPSVAGLPGCERLDIDDFGSDIGSENKQAIRDAQRVLDAGMREFWDWMDRRDTMAHSKLPLGALFPLFVDLSEKRAVFVGGGTIALRRVRTLLPFVGEIAVHAPEFSPELERFGEAGMVTLVRASYDPAQLDGADIAFACTNSPEVNGDVWAECKRRGILVNVCSDRTKCDFYFPGVVKSEGMVVGVSAGGKNHRRVRQLSARIARLLQEEDI